MQSANRKRRHPRRTSVHPAKRGGHPLTIGPQTIGDRHKILAVLVFALTATAISLSSYLAVYATPPDAIPTPSDDPPQMELIIITEDEDDQSAASSDDALASATLLPPHHTPRSVPGDAADPTATPETISDSASTPASEPEAISASPSVPATAPEATAELVATSALFELAPDYPNITMDELCALGDAVEVPLYYAEPIDYTEEDLLWLARIIDREAGSSRYPDILQLLVGNVVLNRVASVEFPDNIRDVIFAPLAYGYDLVAEHRERLTPSDRALQNAKRLLAGERFCPPSVVFQANGRQGAEDYLVIDDELSGRISYFCYAYYMQKYEA